MTKAEKLERAFDTIKTLYLRYYNGNAEETAQRLRAFMDADRVVDTRCADGPYDEGDLRRVIGIEYEEKPFEIDDRTGSVTPMTTYSLLISDDDVKWYKTNHICTLLNGGAYGTEEYDQVLSVTEITEADLPAENYFLW